jgi:hypothetical protein
MKNNLMIDLLDLIPMNLKPQIGNELPLDEKGDLQKHFRGLLSFSEVEYLNLIVKPFLMNYLNGYEGFYVKGKGMASYSASILKPEVIQSYVELINDPELTQAWKSWEWKFLSELKDFGIF